MTRSFRRALRSAALAGALLPLAVACGPSAPSGAPTPTLLPEVGHAVAQWHEGRADQALREALHDTEPTPFQPALLLRTEEEWRGWLIAQPAVLAVTLQAGDARLLGGGASREPDFTFSIAVIGTFAECAVDDRLTLEGPGRLVYQEASTLPGGQQAACAWSPTVVSVYEVPLAELGVSDPADVVLETRR
ncbi:hypothetical protein USB125703_00091 [Pseudoclavibacter triregionum]|nr:hypothetical protein USB125703_00091 [Pseudoclavibacter triregionum]